MRLLTDRAPACHAGFVLSDDDAAYAPQICRELQGGALAIELAADRVEALGLKTIATQFDAAARLSWTGRRTADLRHRTLAATLDWSDALLSDAEQRLLRRLSSFAGTFSLEAAVAICMRDVDPGAEFDMADGQVAKSLVVVEADATMDRCADHFVTWILQRYVDGLDGETLAAIAHELTNMRTMLD